MSDFDRERDKRVEAICRAWETRRLKELEEQREREAALQENKKDITVPVAKAEQPAPKPVTESPLKQLLHKLHLG